MNKKTIITISIILGLAVIVGGFLVSQKTGKQEEMAKSDQKAEVAESGNDQNQKQETQNANNQEMKQDEIRPPNREDWRDAKWITYKDKKNGFEVKYPDSFSIVDASNYYNYQNGDFIIKHTDTQRYIRELNYGAAQISNHVYVSVRKNEAKLSLIKWLQKNDKRCSDCIKQNPIDCKFGCDFHGMKMININGKEALILHEPSITDNEAVYFSLGDRVVEFHGQDVTLDFNNGDNFFKNMMESFKIVK